VLVFVDSDSIIDTNLIVTFRDLWIVAGTAKITFDTIISMQNPSVVTAARAHHFI
jgi:hypothetical protein